MHEPKEGRQKSLIYVRCRVRVSTPYRAVSGKDVEHVEGFEKGWCGIGCAGKPPQPARRLTRQVSGERQRLTALAEHDRDPGFCRAAR